MHPSSLRISLFTFGLVLTLIGMSNTALAHGEGDYEHPDCPVYTGCGPGMAGYVTGMDKHGCEILECVPEEQLQQNAPLGNPSTRGAPQNPINGNNTDDNLKYKYEEPTGNTGGGSRLIEVQ